jgi:hypothetical protein
MKQETSVMVNDVGGRYTPVCGKSFCVNPSGQPFSVPTVSGEALSFEHAGLRVTVRDGRERRFVNRIARVLGYVRSEERDGYHVHTRRDHPRPDARLQLSTWLNELQKQQGVRNAPPRWWDYINIIAAPNALENLNWQLTLI